MPFLVSFVRMLLALLKVDFDLVHADILNFGLNQTDSRIRETSSTPENIETLKVMPVIFLYMLSRKSFRNGRKCILLHLKSFLRSRDIQVFPLLLFPFGLLQQVLMINVDNLTMCLNRNTNTFSDILGSNPGLILKLDQLIEYYITI